LGLRRLAHHIGRQFITVVIVLILRNLDLQDFWQLHLGRCRLTINGLTHQWSGRLRLLCFRERGLYDFKRC
jgi:hypothetical protein